MFYIANNRCNTIKLLEIHLKSDLSTSGLIYIWKPNSSVETRTIIKYVPFKTIIILFSDYVK